MKVGELKKREITMTTNEKVIEYLLGEINRLNSEKEDFINRGGLTSILKLGHEEEMAKKDKMISKLEAECGDFAVTINEMNDKIKKLEEEINEESEILKKIKELSNSENYFINDKNNCPMFDSAWIPEVDEIVITEDDNFILITGIPENKESPKYLYCLDKNFIEEL